MKKLWALAALLIAAACAKETSTESTISSPPPKVATAAAPQEITGLQTPESVLYDADQDVYFVSNINGDPLAKDGNGFISKVNPDTLQAQNFVSSGLDAPKGLTIVGDELWVADINDVKKFDRKTGAAKGKVTIPGSTFLNDLASDGKTAYVSDSGMKSGANGSFEGTGTDSVWQINGNTAKKIASGTDLNRPNGVEVVDGKIWVVSFASNELYQIDNGKKTNVAKVPKGSLDGLVHLADGTFLVSSWESNSVFRGPAAGPFNEVITNVKSPADIGYDTKRHRVLVPHFMENKVTIHALQ